MRDVFQEFETLKPDALAKCNVVDRLKENEYKHTWNFKFLGKLTIAMLMAITLFSIPMIQNLTGNELQVHAKQVEDINKKIEIANSKFKKGKITREEYQKQVIPLVTRRDEVIANIKLLDSNYKVNVTEVVNSDGENVIQMEIDEAK